MSSGSRTRRSPRGSPTQTESPPLPRGVGRRAAELGCRLSIFGCFWWKSLDVTSSALPKPERFPSPPESLRVVVERGPSGQTPAPHQALTLGRVAREGPRAAHGVCERSSGSLIPFLRDWDQMAFVLFV